METQGTINYNDFVGGGEESVYTPRYDSWIKNQPHEIKRILDTKDLAEIIQRCWEFLGEQNSSNKQKITTLQSYLTGDEKYNINEFEKVRNILFQTIIPKPIPTYTQY
jgi:hypothetical protein